MLKRNGLAGMETLYVSRIKVGKYVPDNRFVAFGANGKLIWKHVRGNTVYVDGKKISISYLTGTQAHDLMLQKALLEPLKERKP